jgi:hypothetical protein
MKKNQRSSLFFLFLFIGQLLLSLTGFSMSNSLDNTDQKFEIITNNQYNSSDFLGDQNPIDTNSNEDDTEDSEEESFDEKDAFEDYILTLNEPLFIYKDSSETNSLFHIYNVLSSPNLDVPYSPPEIIAF